MDISREEQRVLHVLAQGGVLEPLKDNRGRIERVVFINRDGFMLPTLDMVLFKKLKRRHTIASRSHESQPKTEGLPKTAKTVETVRLVASLITIVHE